MEMEMCISVAYYVMSNCITYQMSQKFEFFAQKCGAAGHFSVYIVALEG
jgi:hypothetical protein